MGTLIPMYIFWSGLLEDVTRAFSSLKYFNLYAIQGKLENSKEKKISFQILFYIHPHQPAINHWSFHKYR